MFNVTVYYIVTRANAALHLHVKQKYIKVSVKMLAARLSDEMSL